MARIEKKPGKKPVDEQMVDAIVAETRAKNWKERLYDKIDIPVWVLDVLIVLLVAALAAVLIFGRGK